MLPYRHKSDNTDDWIEMDKIERGLKAYFRDSDYAFVLLFGSYADGKENSMSDVDIGLYLNRKVDLKQVGYDAAMLGKKLSKKIDLTILDDIEKKDPLFGFNVLSRHKVIVAEDKEAYVRFKTDAQLSYLDHKPLIDANLAAFKERIKAGKIGERDYA